MLYEQNDIFLISYPELRFIIWDGLDTRELVRCNSRFFRESRNGAI